MKEEATEIEEEFREMEQRTKSEADIMFKSNDDKYKEQSRFCELQSSSSGSSSSYQFEESASLKGPIF